MYKWLAFLQTWNSNSVVGSFRRRTALPAGDVRRTASSSTTETGTTTPGLFNTQAVTIKIVVVSAIYGVIRVSIFIRKNYWMIILRDLYKNFLKDKVLIINKKLTAWSTKKNYFIWLYISTNIKRLKIVNN